MKSNQEFLSICKTTTKEQLFSRVTCSVLCDKKGHASRAIHYFLGIEYQGLGNSRKRSAVISGILDFIIRLA